MTWRARAWCLGLGWMAGAVFHAPAAAQTAPLDTNQHADTLRPLNPAAVPLPADTTKAAKDTIKAALARSEDPPLLDIGRQYHWDRAAIFSSGDYTVADLLAEVPGVTLFKSGFIASPAYVAYLGDPARVRVFLDGVELDALDQRTGGLLDLVEVQLASLEEVSVERGADELRVYLRSWRVERTATSTRIDVNTGDLGSNLYRGYFGKRFKRGEALQLGLQQYGTNTDQFFGGGDQLLLFGRAGWARRAWSVDLFYQNASRNRDPQRPRFGEGFVPQLAADRSEGYLRTAYGNPDSGGWAQAIVALEKFKETTAHNTAAVPVDTVDTSRTVPQYVLAGGWSRGSAHLSVTDRYHSWNGQDVNSLSGRAAWDSKLLGVSLYAERRNADSSSSEEAQARFSPLSFVTFSGAISRRHGGLTPNAIAARFEAGLRLHRLWLSGGLLRRDAVLVPALKEYDSLLVSATADKATGLFGGIHGNVYKDIGLDVWGVHWTAPGWYRPQNQAHAELYLKTNWLHRFPTGHFGFIASGAYEYRGNVLFPITGQTEQFVNGSDISSYGHMLRTRIEVRIIDAYIFFQQQFSLRPPDIDLVPGFLLPRQLLMFGIRWSFWN